jgi:hypothetical protein
MSRMNELVAEFTGFTAREGKGYSPLYERFSAIIAVDRHMWELLGNAPEGFRRATLFFAALQSTVAAHPNEPLAAWFPAVSGRPIPDGDPTEALARFCREHATELAALIRTRRTQTNEVGRSAALLLGLAQVDEPIALVELGASAGLNLLLDEFRYEYETPAGVLAVGDPESPVRVRSELCGTGRVPGRIPVIASRIGIDAAPVDPRDDAAVAWLQACVFADQAERRSRLAGAVTLARRRGGTVRQGLLPDLAVLDEVPDDQQLCLMTSWVLPYLADDDRRALIDGVLARSKSRPISWITMEPAGAMPFRAGDPIAYTGAPPTVLAVSRFDEGIRTDTTLAVTHSHGVWIEWAA